MPPWNISELFRKGGVSDVKRRFAIHGGSIRILEERLVLLVSGMAVRRSAPQQLQMLLRVLALKHMKAKT